MKKTYNNLILGVQNKILIYLKPFYQVDVIWERVFVQAHATQLEEKQEFALMLRMLERHRIANVLMKK